VDSLSGGELSHGVTTGEAAFLAKLKEKKGTRPLARRQSWVLKLFALQRLQRRGLIEIRETVEGGIEEHSGDRLEGRDLARLRNDREKRRGKR